MNEVEKDMLKKAKKGYGALSNNLFKLRFYGYSDNKRKKGIIYKIFSLLIFGIASVITFIIIIAGLAFIMFLIFK